MLPSFHIQENSKLNYDRLDLVFLGKILKLVSKTKIPCQDKIPTKVATNYHNLKIFLDPVETHLDLVY